MGERTRHSNVGERLRVFAGLAATAVLIGNRLSDEALAVLAGAVCGVGAAIPTSLLVVAVSRWRDGPRAPPMAPVPQNPYPPVVVVAPPGGQRGSHAWNTLPPSFSTPVQRHFTVVGGSSVDTEMVAYDR